MNQKELIKSIQQLKEIKPREEWASLLRSQILTEQKAAKVAENKIGIMDVLSTMFAQRKLAYAFSVLLLLVVGIYGFANYSGLFSSPASSVGQTGLKQNVVALGNLAETVKNNKTVDSSTIKNISANANALAKNLKANPAQDPKTLQNIANSLKTLADVPGSNLTTNSDVENLTQTVVQSEIADLQKTTLTASQQKTLVQVQNLYNQKNYTAALEKIWDLSNSANNSSASLPDITGTTSPANK